jgi:hypothetical protein
MHYYKQPANEKKSMFYTVSFNFIIVKFAQ